MLKWLLIIVTWLEKLIASPVLRKQSRALFRFWDGSGWKYLDPLMVLLGIESDDEFRPEIHPQGVDLGDAECTHVMCRLMQRQFGVQQFDPATQKGLTMAEQLALYREFCEFCEELKKSIDLTQMSRSVTGPTASRSSGPITSTTSDSGST